MIDILVTDQWPVMSMSYKHQDIDSTHTLDSIDSILLNRYESGFFSKQTIYSGEKY